jgi:hypothetical protein
LRQAAAKTLQAVEAVASEEVRGILHAVTSVQNIPTDLEQVTATAHGERIRPLELADQGRLSVAPAANRENLLASLENVGLDM